MSVLERAVAELADALDTLETQISDKLDGADGPDADAIRRHVSSARGRADAASEEVAAIITDIKNLLGEGKA